MTNRSPRSEVGILQLVRQRIAEWVAPTVPDTTPEDEPGIFYCHGCDAMVYSFVETRDPPAHWAYDAEINGWFCEGCSADHG